MIEYNNKIVVFLIINILMLTGLHAEEITAVNDSQVRYHLRSCPALDNTPDKIFIKSEDSERSDYVDSNRDIKDFGTKFIVNEFFTSERVLFNFLQLVYQTIEDKLNNFKKENKLDDDAIFLMFKGGNVLRMVAKQFLAMLPKEAQNILEKSYENMFTRSDADFSVLINPDRLNGLDYEETRNQVINITYKALNDIREEFSENPQDYFTFLGFMPKAKKASILKDYFSKLDDTSSLSDPSNPNWYQAHIEKIQLLDQTVNHKLKCRYKGQYDYLYENDPHSVGDIIGTTLSSKPHWIANSINKTLKWEVSGHKEKIVKFDLVRAKVYFEYSYIKDNLPYRKPIGGELIDVSFPHIDDFRLRHFLANLDKWVVNYTLKFNNTGESIVMKAESVDGIAQDLYDVVFEQFDRPWNDPKFEKRINRLFLLSIVNMLSGDISNDDIKNYISLVDNNIIRPLNNIDNFDGNKLNNLIPQLENTINNIKIKYKNIDILNNIFQGLFKLINGELLNNPKDDDKDKFIELMKVINKNIATIVEINNLNIPKINKTKIYKTDISKLL